MNIFIDESGSMTHETHCKFNEKFIICLILTDNTKKVKNVHKRFVSKFYDDLKKADTSNSMFKDGNFSELKGCGLTPDLKREFVKYFCKNNHFKCLLIEMDNTKATPNFYANKARAFNYVLKLAFEHLYNIGILRTDSWDLHIDERNVAPDSKHHLREFLLTELATGKNLTNSINTTYHDSSTNKLIQIADVFANLYFSNHMTNGGYQAELDAMTRDDYLIKVFYYPPNF